MISEIVLFLTSDTTTTSNIINKSADGSRFTILLNPNLVFDKSCKNIKVYAQSARYWFTFKNISVTKANNHIFFTDNIAIPSKYDITIQDGLYSLEELNSAINFGVLSLSLPTGTITLSGDSATQKVIFTLKTGYQMYFSATTPYLLLGMNLNQKLPAAALTTTLYSERATNPATFSNLASVLYHCSLISNSIVNGRNSDVILSVPPKVGVGSLMDHQPYNLLKVNCSNLQNATISSIDVYITDQNGNTLDTNSENFEITLVIEYES